MGLPDPLPLTVEINPTGSAWVDITSYVRDADGVTIDTGRADEAESVGPTMCRLLVDNRAGHFSRHNPNGNWYPDLGLGTPLRAYWDTTANMRFSGEIVELPTRWNQAQTDSTAPLVAASLLRRLEQGAPALRSALFRSLSTHDNVVAYWPCEEPDGSSQASSPIAGVPAWRLSAEFGSVEGPAGSDQLLRVVTGQPSTLARVPTHTAGDVYVVQVAWRMDEAAPAGGRQMLNVFTTSTTLSRWTLSITDTSFVVRAWDNDEVLVVNDSAAIHADLIGQWVRVELRLRTNGTSVDYHASVTTADVDATVLNDLIGTETSSTKGRVTKVGVGDGGNWATDRYFGHLGVLTGTSTELPVLSLMDPLTGTDRNAPFHGWTGELAADRFERLCEEEGLTCTIVAPTGGLELSGASGVNATTPDAASLDITGDIDVRAWIAPNLWEPETADRVLSKWATTGDQRSWSLLAPNSLPFATGFTGISFSWSTGGTAGTVSTVNGQLPFKPADGDPLAVRVTLDVDNGSSQHVVTMYVGPSLDGPWTQFSTTTNSGTTSIHSGSANLHVGATDDDTDYDGKVLAARVYSGIAGTLVADPDFTAQTIGATSFTDSTGKVWTINGDAAIVRADDSMPMGPQQIDTLIANMQACADADRGRFYEDPNGLVLRTISDLYNQTAALALSSSDLSAPPEPTDDDQQIVNDMTASRPGGGTARYVDQDHIDMLQGSVYDSTVTANVETDDQLAQVAAWLVHLGTVDEMRWPRIELKLHGKPNLIDGWLAVRLGDRITISHDLTQLPGVDIDLLVEGWSEHINQTEWNVVLNCVPASPYDVAVFGTARFDTAGSATSGSFVAGTGTSLTVTSTGRPWVNSTDHASEFPFHIKVSGVVLNVTAISGSTSPQTFTVTQAPVNGVTKTIASGSAVALADTPAFAL